MPLTSLPQKPAAPPLQLTDIGGRSHNIDDLRGQVIVVNFWTTWCPPCRAEMPSFQRLRDQFPRGKLALLAVNVGESRQDIAKFFFSQHPPPTYTILMTRGKPVSAQWHVQTLPTTYIVDKSGRVLYAASGARAWDSNEIRTLIREMIDTEQSADAAR